MLNSKEAPPRLSSDQVMTMKLFEIADRLASIEEMLGNRVPEGVLHSSDFTASTTVTQVILTHSGTVYNDGAADIYILDIDRNIDNSDSPLKSGESIAIDYKERGQYSLWIKTLTGTATVRIFGLR